MTVKQAIGYETECPSCLSLIQFGWNEIDHEIIICPICRYRIGVMGKEEHGCRTIFKNSVRPRYKNGR